MGPALPVVQRSHLQSPAQWPHTSPRAGTRADVFDPANTTWRQLADLPNAITDVNAVLDGRSVWIAGGFKDGYPGKAIAEVWNSDIDQNTYAAAPSLPEPRAGGGLALVGRRLHYTGGLMEDRDTDSADHWVLDLDGVLDGFAKWKSAAPIPEPRNQFGTVTLDGKIYAMGGQYHHDSGQRISRGSTSTIPTPIPGAAAPM